MQCTPLLLALVISFLQIHKQTIDVLNFTTGLLCSLVHQDSSKTLIDANDASVMHLVVLLGMKPYCYSKNINYFVCIYRYYLKLLVIMILVFCPCQ